MDTGFVRLGSVQLESLEIGDLQTGTERERREGERDDTVRKAGHTLIIPVRIKRRRGGAGVEMGFGAKEVGSCSVSSCLCPQQRSSKATPKTGEKERPNMRLERSNAL